MSWDFETRPELPNSMLDFYYFQSPHKQIFEDFRAKVVKVVDGDTIRVEVNFRDFDFPVRFLDINAPEMSEGGGEAKEWLRNLIENAEIDILMNKKNRVGKYGRLLGKILFRGINIGNQMKRDGRATAFNQRNEGKIPNINKELSIKKWF